MRSGESFEQEVKGLIEYHIKQGDLGIDTQLVKVFLHKGYWSRVRGKPITMDVSVELYRRGAVEPYLVWIWECKDYRHRVPVDDVEEFHTKLEQIGLHKTKGTMVCRNGFQESTIRVAEAYGISLARILPDGSVIRLMEAAGEPTISREFTVFGLTQPDTEQLTTLVYGLSSSSKSVTDIGDLIAQEIGPEIDPLDQEKKGKVPCTPDIVDGNDNGKEVYLSRSDCPVVKYWANRYNARVQVRWLSAAGTWLLADPGDLICGSGWEKGETVWAASSLIVGASNDAYLIRRLVSASSRDEYNRIRHTLSKSGYPKGVLDSVSPPSVSG